MKVIDLLNKIANGEEVPKYIRYYNKNEHMQLVMIVCIGNIIYKLNENAIDLNDEVEIIEEPKEHKIPEKLKERDNGIYLDMPSNQEIMNKINEILDYLEANNDRKR